MNTIEKMIEDTISKEGGYSDHPSDRGGPTRWGVTQAEARANGYTGDMRQLPREKAVAIYRQLYAIKPGFAAVAEISPRVGAELFDTGVNMGPAVAAKAFQRALNVLNSRGKHYADIVADGKIGAKTLAAFRALLAKRGKDGETVMLRVLNALQGARYVEISEAREANEDFTFGWFLNRVEMP